MKKLIYKFATIALFAIQGVSTTASATDCSGGVCRPSLVQSQFDIQIFMNKTVKFRADVDAATARAIRYIDQQIDSTTGCHAFKPSAFGVEAGKNKGIRPVIKFRVNCLDGHFINVSHSSMTGATSKIEYVNTMNYNKRGTRKVTIRRVLARSGQLR